MKARYDMTKWETEVNYKVPYSDDGIAELELTDETARALETLYFDSKEEALKVLADNPAQYYIVNNGKSTAITVCELCESPLDEDGEYTGDVYLIGRSELPELTEDEDIIKDLIATYDSSPRYVKTLQDFKDYVLDEVCPNYADVRFFESLIEEAADRLELEDEEKELKILLSTGMTEREAKNYVKTKDTDSGYIIYEVDDYLKNFNEYAYAGDEDDERANEHRAKLKAFLEAGDDGSFIDSVLTTYKGVKYYIEFWQ